MEPVHPLCKNRLLMTAGPAASLQCRSEDAFFPAPDLACHYRKIVDGSAEWDNPCSGYSNFLQNIPSPFLSEPKTQQRLNQIVALASHWKVTQEELMAVFNNALPEYSIEDRVLRVRSYLLFYVALNIWRRMAEDPDFAVSRGWQHPFFADDFEDFACAALAALSFQQGNPNIQENTEIKSASGSPLSGDYDPLSKKIRLSIQDGNIYGDWEIYVQFHEFYHWYDFQYRHHTDSLTIEDREWAASRAGMRALLLLKQGPVSFLVSGEGSEKQKKRVEEDYKKIENDLSLLPPDLQAPYQIVYEKLKEQIQNSHSLKFLNKLHQIVSLELATGLVDKASEQEGRLLLRQWRFSRERMSEFKLFAEKAGRPPNLETPLQEILFLASNGQLSLAIHRLHDLFNAQKELPILSLE